jgi:predicted lipoprotein with Yx(FWY)xxD motif
MRTSTATAVIVLVALLLGGLFWFSMQESPAPTPQTDVTSVIPDGAAGLNGAAGQTNTGQVDVPPVVTVATSSKLGDFLVAENGMTLYMYAKDATNTSNCKDQCAANWPPYAVSTTEPLVAGDGISGLLSTIVRDDGVTQLTYNGVPLYQFKNDKNPGEASGQGLNKVWSVVKP